MVARGRARGSSRAFLLHVVSRPECFSNGLQDFIGDFTGSGPNPVTLSSLTSLLSSSSSGTGSIASVFTDPASITSAIGNLPTTISTSLSNASGLLTATGDVLNGAVVSIPSYDVGLFVDGIQQAFDGQPVTGLVNAIGGPVAADIALYMYLGEIEGAAIDSA